MPFCGASKTKTPSAQQVKKGAEVVSRAAPQQNGAAPATEKATVAAANNAAVEEQVAVYKQESAAQHQQEVTQWEKKFDEKITEVKTKQAQKHNEEVNTIQQHHEQERSQHHSEIEALQAEIAALQKAQAEAKPIISSESGTRALSVHNSYVAPAPVETIVTRNVAPVEETVVEYKTVPVMPMTTSVDRTHSTTEYKPLATYHSTTAPVTTYAHSGQVYENTTVPTGEGLPDTRITYTVISDGTATAIPTTYTETAPRVSTSEYVTTRSIEPITTTYGNTNYAAGEGLPEGRVTYTVISEGATTHSVPRATEYSYASTAKPVTRTYTTAPTEYTYTTSAPVGDYQYTPRYTATSVPTTYSVVPTETVLTTDRGTVQEL